LDKYATNEYMARSLVIGVAFSWAVLAVIQLARQFGEPPQIVLRQHPEYPMPDILPGPTVKPVQPAYKPPGKKAATQGRWVPVPEPIEWLPGESGSPGATAPATDETTESGGGDVVDLMPAAEPEIMTVVEEEPVLVSIRQPVYPEIAREAGIEGTVTVRVLVWSDGSVRDLTVLEAVLGLEDAALEAAATAVFRPATQQGRPVATWTILPIEFRLHD
jgi:protein TonB